MKSAVSPDKKLANAVGGKSARPCDNCVKKRARWYCAADDAFLCQSCDSSVHSANPLARRHERVRLKTASTFDEQSTRSQSNAMKNRPSKISIAVPTWHRGVTKRARTPRGKKHAKVESDGESKLNQPLHLVPEISSDHSQYENEEQLLYRVPIFDPFVAELCSSANPDESANNLQSFGHGKKVVSDDFSQEMSHLHNFLPSELDLAEFAADVESLLGKGLEDESFDMESLGLMDTKECSLGTERVKNEDEEEIGEAQETEFELIDMGREETFELNFDYDCEEEDDVKAEIGKPAGVMLNNELGSNSSVNDSKRSMLLRLDYQGVLSAWDDHKSPWTTGERPELDDSGDCWPACMGTCGRIHVYGDMGLIGGHAPVTADGGREARVSRYREKRRTRLFSKKIRYEVRKLNAEKRPRMKGRFVKRANLVASGVPVLKN